MSRLFRDFNAWIMSGSMTAQFGNSRTPNRPCKSNSEERTGLSLVAAKQLYRYDHLFRGFSLVYFTHLAKWYHRVLDLQIGQTLIHCLQPSSYSMHSRAQTQTQVNLMKPENILGNLSGGTIKPRVLSVGQRKFVTHRESGRSSWSTSFMTADIDPSSTLVFPWGKGPKSIYSIFRDVGEARMAKLVFECSSGSGLMTWDVIYITFPSFHIQPEAPLHCSASFPPATPYLKLPHLNHIFTSPWTPHPTLSPSHRLFQESPTSNHESGDWVVTFFISERRHTAFLPLCEALQNLVLIAFSFLPHKPRIFFRVKATLFVEIRLVSYQVQYTWGIDLLGWSIWSTLNLAKNTNFITQYVYIVFAMQKNIDNRHEAKTSYFLNIRRSGLLSIRKSSFHRW
jgi:hypothetical protein